MRNVRLMNLLRETFGRSYYPSPSPFPPLYEATFRSNPLDYYPLNLMKIAQTPLANNPLGVWTRCLPFRKYATRPTTNVSLTCEFQLKV